MTTREKPRFWHAASSRCQFDNIYFGGSWTEGLRRKPYKPPILTKYGNVAKLTAGANGTGMDPGHATSSNLSVRKQPFPG